MPRFTCAVVGALLLLTSSALGGETLVRRDTYFPVEIVHTIKGKTAKVGDPIEFRTLEAVLIGKDIVVPRNATILGTIIAVQKRGPEWPRSLVRIRIHTLLWKDGEAKLNAMIASILRPHMDATEWSFRYPPTFLEGIRVVSHQRREAFTEFFSDRKDVVLRSGVAFMLRQIDPDRYPEQNFDVYKSDDDRTAENW
jgi:hypothetical protein